MPTEWREITGYLSRHQLVDAEVSQLAYFLDIMKIIDVYVTHDRPDLTGRSADETAKLKQYFEGNPSDPRDFHHTTFAKWRQADLEQVGSLHGLDETGPDLFQQCIDWQTRSLATHERK
jgi:hypothetical protein